MRLHPNWPFGIVWFCLGLAISAPFAVRAAEIVALVKGQDGKPVSDAVVVAAPVDGAWKAPGAPSREIIDQVNHAFVPRVKPVLVGTAVSFPNKDNVRHHVYSLSPAKRFELPLYAGTPAEPVTFDKVGVVVLGCNIHDWMIGYVYVSESPWFGKTGADGRVVLANLPARAYWVRVWHPQMEGTEEDSRKQADLSKTAHAEVAWDVKLKADFTPHRLTPGHGTGRY